MDFHVAGLVSSLVLGSFRRILLHSITSPADYNTDSFTNKTDHQVEIHKRSTMLQSTYEIRSTSSTLHVTLVTPLGELAFLSRPVGHNTMLKYSPLGVHQLEQLLVSTVDLITLV